MISLEKQFLFVHVPKTAGNALQNILRQYSEDRIIAEKTWQDGTDRFEVRSDRFRTHKHSTLADYRRFLGRDCDRLFKFCVVRNPWDRVISHYAFLQQHAHEGVAPGGSHTGDVVIDRGSLRKFIGKVKPLQYYTERRRRGWTTATWAPFSNPFRRTEMDCFIRYENLQEDFAHVCRRLGIGEPQLTVRNRSQHRPYAEYYDADTRTAVYRRFRHEIEFFGYRFEAGW